MNKFKIWLGWFVMMALNTAMFVVPAIHAGFPVRTIVLLLVALEGVPLLWVVGIIPTNLFITGDFIGGIWAVMQIAIMVAAFYFASSSLPFLGIVLTAVIFTCFFAVRVKIMAKFLSRKNT